MTLTFEVNIDSVESNQRAKYQDRRLLSSKVIVHTLGHNHTRSIVLPGPLKSSVTVRNVMCYGNMSKWHRSDPFLSFLTLHVSRSSRLVFNPSSEPTLTIRLPLSLVGAYVGPLCINLTIDTLTFLGPLLIHLVHEDETVWTRRPVLTVTFHPSRPVCQI